MTNQRDIQAASAYVRLYTKGGEWTKGLDQAGQKLSKFGSQIKSIGTQVAIASGAIGLPLALSAKHFASFDDAIRATAAVTGSLGESGAASLQLLTDTARKLGATTSFTAIQVANLMTELGRAGFKPDEIVVMTDAVLALSRATGTDATLSAGIMAATLRQFSLGAGDAARAADVLTKAANSTFNTVEGLGESLKYAGPVAASLGMTLEDTTAILGVLGNVGIQGSEAGTALRRLGVISAASGKELKSLFNVSNVDSAGKLKPLVQILDDINTATKDMPLAQRTAKMAEAFGLLGITSANVLSQTAGGVAQLSAELKIAEGTAKRTSDAMDAGLGGSMRIALSAIEGVALAIGDSLAGGLKEIIDVFSGAATALTLFIGNNKQLIVTIAKVTAGIAVAGAALFAIGGAIALAGAAISGAATLASGFAAVLGAIGSIGAIAISALASPLGIAIGLFGGLAAASFFASEEGGKAIFTLGEMVTGLGQIFNDTWSGIVAAVQAGDLAKAGDIAWLGLQIGFQQVVVTIRELMDAVSRWFIGIWNGAADAVADVLVGSFFGIQTAWVSIIAGLKTGWNNFLFASKATITEMVSLFKKAWAYVTALWDPSALEGKLAKIEKERTDAHIANQEKQTGSRLQNKSDFESQLAEIQSNRSQMAGILKEDRSRRDQELAMPSQGLTEAQSSLAASKEKLKAISEEQKAATATKKAAEEAKKTKPPTPDTSGGAGNGGLVNDAVSSLKVSASGIFSGFAVRSLGGDIGGGSPAERTARATEKTAKNTDAIRKQGVEFTT
ncbi:MAG: phage tail tape measure protein [Pirellulaceae bacterium]|nr:phage tail tape measure protein [Pirellulaceae bacterium]